MQHKSDLVNNFSDLAKLKSRKLLNQHAVFKRGIDNKVFLSAARVISTNFENVDLRKQASPTQIKRARKIVKEFLMASRYADIKFVKPSKKNRKLYADYAGVSSNFRYIPMPIYDESDTFKIRKGRVIHSGKHFKSDFFKFKSRKELVKNPLKEVEKTYKYMEKQYGKRKFRTRIKCGRAEYAVQFSDAELVARQIDKFMMAYGSENVQKWCMGLVGYEFTNQEITTIQPLKKKKKKPKKWKD